MAPIFDSYWTRVIHLLAHCVQVERQDNNIDHYVHELGWNSYGLHVNKVERKRKKNILVIYKYIDKEHIEMYKVEKKKKPFSPIETHQFLVFGINKMGHGISFKKECLNQDVFLFLFFFFHFLAMAIERESRIEGWQKEENIILEIWLHTDESKIENDYEYADCIFYIWMILMKWCEYMVSCFTGFCLLPEFCIFFLSNGYGINFIYNRFSYLFWEFLWFNHLFEENPKLEKSFIEHRLNTKTRWKVIDEVLLWSPNDILWYCFIGLKYSSSI